MARQTKNDSNNVINGVVQLKEEFDRVSGKTKFHHKRVYHKDGWFIYKVNVCTYEVFKEKVINGVSFVDGKIKNTDVKKIKYPNDNDFGVWAWCCSSLEDAMKYVK